MTIRGWDKYMDDTKARRQIGFALNRLGFIRDSNDKRTVKVPGHGTMRIAFFKKGV